MKTKDFLVVMQRTNKAPHIFKHLVTTPEIKIFFCLGRTFCNYTLCQESCPITMNVARTDLNSLTFCQDETHSFCGPRQMFYNWQFVGSRIQEKESTLSANNPMIEIRQKLTSYKKREKAKTFWKTCLGFDRYLKKIKKCLKNCYAVLIN